MFIHNNIVYRFVISITPFSVKSFHTPPQWRRNSVVKVNLFPERVKQNWTFCIKITYLTATLRAARRSSYYIKYFHSHILFQASLAEMPLRGFLKFSPVSRLGFISDPCNHSSGMHTIPVLFTSLSRCNLCRYQSCPL